MVSAEPSPLRDAPSAWVLELGEAARRAEHRSTRHAAQGHHLRAWSSRRESARARRRLVETLLAGNAPEDVGDEQLSLDVDTPELPVIAAALPPPDPLPKPPIEAPVADEEEIVEDGAPEKDLSPALLDRIAAYTTSER